MNKKQKRLVIAAIIAIIIIGIRFSPLADYFTLQSFKIYKTLIMQAVQNYYLLSVLIYFSVYTIFTAFALPEAGIFTIVAGFIFGAIPATIYIVVAATIGSCLAFIMARYLVGDWLQEKYKNRLINFNKRMEQNGIFYFLSLRLFFVIPIFITTILAGLTKLSLFTFFWTTAIGIIPGTFFYAFAGHQLNRIKKVSDIFSLNILLVFLALALLPLIPIIYNRFKKYFHR